MRIDRLDARDDVAMRAWHDTFLASHRHERQYACEDQRPKWRLPVPVKRPAGEAVVSKCSGAFPRQEPREQLHIPGFDNQCSRHGNSDDEPERMMCSQIHDRAVVRQRREGVSQKRERYEIREGGPLRLCVRQDDRSQADDEHGPRQ